MTINDANLKFNGSPGIRKRTTALVLHHSDTESGTVQTFHAYHQSKGWLGIGYHYVVYKDGSVWRGRPENWIGAQAEGANSYTIGICFVGKYNEETVMPDAQFRSGLALLCDLRSRYPGIEIQPHKHFDNTACPGQYFPFDRLVAGSGENTAQPEPPESAQNPLLVKGSNRAEVKVLQSRLNELGYNCGAVDGIFGIKTEAAVKAFQFAAGLLVDGKVGEKTWAALQSPSAPATKAANPYAKPGSNLKRGSKGDGVRWVQWALNQRGAGLKIDGDFGVKTEAAVKSFQKTKGLVTDGIVGPKTRGALEV